MVEVETGRFTVGVFQDVAWAKKGLDALMRAGLPAESLSIIAKDSADVGSLIQQTLGRSGRAARLTGAGTVLTGGPLVDALQRLARDLPTLGLSGRCAAWGFSRTTAGFSTP